MWVIVGDLVSIHMELIFGTKNINWHHPFAKTQKTDSAAFKVKKDKNGHEQKVHFDAVLTGIERQLRPVQVVLILFAEKQNQKALKYCSNHHLRGPPVLS